MQITSRNIIEMTYIVGSTFTYTHTHTHTSYLPAKQRMY